MRSFKSSSSVALVLRPRIAKWSGFTEGRGEGLAGVTLFSELAHRLGAISGALWLEALDLFEKAACGLTRDERNEDDPATHGFQNSPFVDIDRFQRVVAPFDPDIGAHAFEKITRPLLGEYRDSVHGGKRREEAGAVRLGIDWARRPLQGGDTRVAIDSDQQQISLRSGRLEVGNVADVEQIETAVGHNNAAASLSLGLAPGGDFGEGKNPLARGHPLSVEEGGRSRQTRNRPRETLIRPIRPEGRMDRWDPRRLGGIGTERCPRSPVRGWQKCCPVFPCGRESFSLRAGHSTRARAQGHT